MAHAYTTKRGKNKKSKLGVRKDQQQNQEKSLKHSPDLNAFLYDGPKESSFGIAGHITGGNSNNARLESVRSRLQRQLADKCSNPECSQAQNGHLSECSACRQTRYCSKDCQKAHWPAHKDQCKAKRKEMQQQEEERQLHVLQALEGLRMQGAAGQAGDVNIAEKAGGEDEDDDEEEEDDDNEDDEEEEPDEANTASATENTDQASKLEKVVSDGAVDTSHTLD